MKQVTVQREKRPPFCPGLVPAAVTAHRQAIKNAMSIAYASVGNTGAENWQVWNHHMGKAAQMLQEAYQEAGWTAAPGIEDSFWFRVDLPQASQDGIVHQRFVVALATDYGPRLAEHIEYRLRTRGNLHASLSGPTGMAKSSCAIGLADWMTRIQAGTLLRRNICLDVSKLPRLLTELKRGECAIMDEYTQQAGEGARTLQMMFSNIEDTIRASGVSLLMCSPQMQEHGTMQFNLELVLWRPPMETEAGRVCPSCRLAWRGGKCACGWEPASLFVVWINGQPHGVVALPWCRPELWAEYDPWKEKNVGSSLAGQFKDASQTATMAQLAFTEERLVRWLESRPGKPKKVNFEHALTYFVPAMLATSELKRIAHFMWEMASTWKTQEGVYLELFHIEASPGFLRVVARYGPGKPAPELETTATATRTMGRLAARASAHEQA